MQLFLDIETIPSQDKKVIERIREKAEADFKVPNKSIAEYAKDLGIDVMPDDKRKKADWQNLWADKFFSQQIDDEVRKTSFNGSYGQVLMIGCSFYDELIIFRGAEKEALNSFCDFVKNKLAENHSHTSIIQFVGHNVLEFDLKFLYQRMVINGIAPFFRWPLSKYGDQIFDTMSVWTNYGRISLDELCHVLDIPSPKTDLDGSKVYKYYLQGREDEIAEYCKSDVMAVMQVFNKMTFKE